MKALLVAIIGILFMVGITGCNVSKPYVITKDRVDQQLNGNRGYLKGTPPPEKDRGNLKRQFLAVDIDLPEIKGKPTQETKLVGMEKVTNTINSMGREPSAAILYRKRSPVDKAGCEESYPAPPCPEVSEDFSS